jgi:hypothetical protein
MHYKNGREAKENDPVVVKSYNGFIAGKISRLNAGSNNCNGVVTFPVLGNSEGLCVTVSECYHAEDAYNAMEGVLNDAAIRQAEHDSAAQPTGKSE